MFKTFLFRAMFCTSLLLLALFLLVSFLNPIFTSESIIFPYSLRPFDICLRYPIAWHYMKIAYVIFYFLSMLILSNSVYLAFFKDFKFTTKPKEKSQDSSLSLLLGEDIIIPEKGLYQNMLVTGTIGTGKTSSAMYPFCEQLISYEALNDFKKIGMLILDVKGNFYKQVLEIAKRNFREDDVIVIELNGKYRYNPLDKPNLKPVVLADRLKTILTLFSKNNSDSYWFDKAAQVLAEAIKLCRFYNNGYVTFTEIQKLISSSDYFKSKILILKEAFKNGAFSQKDCFDLLTAIEFFETEFYSLDSRVLSILQSEITRITSVFTSDYEISSLFCPKKENLNFSGFRDVLEKGKIVVLHMNIAEHQNLAKILAAYLKLDFQAEVMASLSYEIAPRTTAFLCDEFQEFVTASDANFFAQSREARCINIVSTQSYSSLLDTLKDQTSVRVIVQNLINKLWFRTDDSFTIEEIQKQLGKEEKLRTSSTLSENAKETNYDFLTHTFRSQNSNLAESVNTYTQTDFIYDTNFFTSELKTFECLAFCSDGFEIMKPKKIKLTPYFQNRKDCDSYEK